MRQLCGGSIRRFDWTNIMLHVSCWSLPKRDRTGFLHRMWCRWLDSWSWKINSPFDDDICFLLQYFISLNKPTLCSGKYSDTEESASCQFCGTGENSAKGSVTCGMCQIYIRFIENSNASFPEWSCKRDPKFSLTTFCLNTFIFVFSKKTLNSQSFPELQISQLVISSWIRLLEGLRPVQQTLFALERTLFPCQRRAIGSTWIIQRTPV